MSDLIDRQKALDALKYEMKYGAVIDGCGLDTAYDVIENLSSAEPERKTGKWIEREVFESKGQVEELQSAKCSVCGKYHTTPYLYYFDNYPYCPSCGADMRGNNGKA